MGRVVHDVAGDAAGMRHQKLHDLEAGWIAQCFEHLHELRLFVAFNVQRATGLRNAAQDGTPSATPFIVIIRYSIMPRPTCQSRIVGKSQLLDLLHADSRFNIGLATGACCTITLVVRFGHTGRLRLAGSDPQDSGRTSNGLALSHTSIRSQQMAMVERGEPNGRNPPDVGCARPTGGPVGENPASKSGAITPSPRKEPRRMIQVGQARRRTSWPRRTTRASSPSEQALRPSWKVGGSLLLSG